MAAAGAGSAGTADRIGDEDLELDSQWYAKPDLQLPSSLAGGNFVRDTAHKDGVTTLKLSIRMADLSVEKLMLAWLDGCPEAVEIAERTRGPPPPELSYDELRVAALEFGLPVAEFAASQKGKRIASGSSIDLVDKALQAGKAMLSAGGEFGVVVMIQFTSEVIKCLDMPRKGDILQFQAAAFADGSSTPAQHLAIVTSSEPGPDVEVVEQDVRGSPVQAGHYNLRGMSQGLCIVFRPVSPTYMEPLE